MATHYKPRIVTDGMVLCLDAANVKSYPRTGLVWYDKSGNDYNGALVNTTFSGSSLNLDSSTYMTIPQSNGQFSNSTNMTYEAWIYPTGLDNNGSVIFQDRPAYNNTYGVQIFIYDSAGHVAVRGSGVASTEAGLTNGIVTQNNWNHLAVCFSGSTAYVYINNVRQTGENLTTLYPISTSTYDMNIGRYATVTGTYNLRGKLSIIRIYNKTLTQMEVSQNYNALKGRFGL